MTCENDVKQGTTREIWENKILDGIEENVDPIRDMN